MNSDPSMYLRVAHAFSDTLVGVRDDQWHNATPCEAWNVTDLVEHVIATHQRVYKMADENGIEGVDLESSLGAQWIVELRAYEKGLNDPALADVPITTRRGEQPFSGLVEGLLMIDTLCHSWDLARATDADERLDPEAVALAHAQLAEMGDAIRVPGGFKDAIPPAPGADAQTQFLNYTGRRV